MKILRNMVFREFLGIFVACVLTVTVLFVLIDFFDRVQRFVGEGGAPVRLLGRYLVFKLPQVLYDIIPLTMPLAALVTLGVFNRRSELMAMRAAGIPIRSVLRPVFLFALLMAAFLFAIQEQILPYSNLQRRLVHSEIKRYKKSSKRAMEGKRAKKGPVNTISGWYRGAAGIYYLRGYRIVNKRIRNLILIDVDKDSRVRRRIDAQKVFYRDGKWIGYDVTVRDFSDPENAVIEHFDKTVIDIPETPEELEVMEKETGEMGFFELATYIIKLEEGGSDMRPFRVDLWAKLSYPLSGVILLVLAAPLGLKSGRGTGVAGGIVWSLVISLTYYEFNAWVLSLGRGGVIDTPIVAAWIAPVLFGVVAFPMYLRSN